MTSHKLSILPILICVVCSGAAVRLIGLHHGAPDLLYHPDVSKQAQVARLVFTDDGDLTELYDGDFTKVLYPFGTATIVGRAARLVARSHDAGTWVAERNTWWWARWMRYLAASLSVLSAGVLTAFLFGRMGTVPALLAGMLLVVEPINAQYSHYAMNDVPMAAMLILAWMCTAGMWQTSRAAVVMSFLCGLCLGLGFAIKYQAAYGLVFPAFAFGRTIRWEKGWSGVSAKALLFVAGGAAGVLFAQHVIVSEPRFFLEHFDDLLHWQANFLGLDEPLTVRLQRNGLWMLRFMAGSRLWVLVPGALWAVGKLCVDRSNTGVTRPMIASAAAFCLLMLLTLLVARELMREHDFLTVIPFLILMNAYALQRRPDETIGAPRRCCLAMLTAALVLLTGVFGAQAVADSMALTRTDTRQRAQEWCQANIAPDARVFREKYTLSVFGESATEYRFNFFTPGLALQALDQRIYDVVITSSLVHNRYYDALSPYHDKEWQRVYELLNTQYDKAAEFRDRQLYFAHPTIAVYVRREPTDVENR